MTYKFFNYLRRKKLEEANRNPLDMTFIAYDNYRQIISTLDSVKPENEAEYGFKFCGDDIAMARGIYLALTTPKFLFMAAAFNELLQLMEPADAILQSCRMGFRSAVPIIINSLIEDVKKFRKDEVFDRIALSMQNLQDELQLSEPARRGRRRASCVDESFPEENELIS